MSEGIHTYIATFICTIYVHKYTHIATFICTVYVHTYTHYVHNTLASLHKSIAPNKMAYPAMHEQYAVIMVPDFITATQAMVNVVDHLYSENN